MFITLVVLILGSAVTVKSSGASGRILHVTSSNISTLHQYLDNSHHHPLCVIFTEGSQLERNILKLWLASDQARGQARDQTGGPARGQAIDCSLKSWVLATVSSIQIRRLPGYLQKDGNPSQSPMLRCFLGPLLPHDFATAVPTTTKQLRKWFCQLATHHYHLVNGSVDTIEASVHDHRFTIVVFPTVQQHEDLEQTTFLVTEKLAKESTVSTIVIHPSSANIRDIVERYKVLKAPCVLLIEQESRMERKQKLYNIHDVMTGRMETDMRASLIPAPQLSLSEFKAEVVRVNPGQHYSPFLVGFYAYWQQGSAVFLSFLRDTVLEFRSLGSDMRFGLVDAAHNPQVLSHFMSAKCVQHLPFLAVFYADEGQSTVNQRELLVTRPTPFTVYSALQEAGLVLRDSSHQPISYQPYGQNTQVCLQKEGLDVHHCSSNNTTWLSDPDFITTPLLSTHLSQDTNRTVAEAENLETVPLATASSWINIGESCEGGDRDVPVFIQIFIFIRYPCRSCEENQPCFLQIYQQLLSNDSYRVQIVNCSQTVSPCERLHITGFPSVLAFRSHTAPAPCATEGSNPSHRCAQSVRLDYHGVLTVPAVMVWISSISVSPVQSLGFGRPHWTVKATARLIATVVPLSSAFLPLPPHRDRGYFYSTVCLRELCERLFGLLSCFTAYSSQVPSSHFKDHDAEFAVIQVDFQRRDNISVTLMQLGQSLADLLDQQTDSALHMFHTHHRYQLLRKQKCEEDHSICTTFLESFSRDHLRLPVTPLTSEILHAHTQFLFVKKMAVLLALVEADYSSQLQEVLQKTAYRFYKEMIVATLDVGMFSVWAGSFVPRDYNRLHAESASWGKMSVYPRLVLFFWHEHTRAAFYPPVNGTTSSEHANQQSADSTVSSQLLTEDLIADFVQSFLKDPASHLIETERF